MQCICTPQDIKQLGTILGIWAHPDDETFTMGGIMAAAILNGQVVACLTATCGEQGIQDEKRWPAASLKQIRTDELLAAMKILGVSELCWLDYPDGGCENVDQQEAVKKIVACIAHYRPDSIFTFGHDGLTGHPDHCTVSDWTKKAVERAGSRAVIYNSTRTTEQYAAMREADKQFNLFYNINKPPVCEPHQCAICAELSDEIYDLKLAALKAMPSQYEALLRVFEPSLRLSLGIEAFVAAE